jgi:hypothetical protein
MYYRKTLEGISIGNNFLDRTPIVQEIRATTDKCGCIKLKSHVHQGNHDWNQKTSNRVGENPWMLFNR